MSVDTSCVLEIEASPWKMLGLAVLGVGMTALSAAMAFRLLPNVGAGSFYEFVGNLGVLFFGLCTGLVLWRALRQRGPVVTITPEGIRDIRVAAEFVPWSAVKAISTWSCNRQKFIVFDIDPEVESRLTLTRIAKWTRGANRGLGADGLCIGPQGLKIGYDKLLDICAAYVEAARRDG